jgi:transglutaminase-like putative cysteine protease
MVRPRSESRQLVVDERSESEPAAELSEFLDLYGNRSQRLVLPPGDVALRYEASVEASDDPDSVDLHALQRPVEHLPHETLLYTLPSRYCLSDELMGAAWELFAGSPTGWGRVQAVCDWVFDHLGFRYGSSSPLTTAVDVYRDGAGVCRDFTHLGITFCRALNIPARYVFGYIPEIDVPPSEQPMDFCAWMEVYLSDRWWTFDPRNNDTMPRRGRVVIGRGRDALDVAMVTTYGRIELTSMEVIAEPAAATRTSPGQGP